MRCDPKQHGPLETRRSQASHIGVLDITYSPVHDLEAVGRGARGEVLPLYQGRPEAAKCGLTRRGGARCAAADDQDVECFSAETVYVPVDAACGFHQSIIANF